MTFYNVPFAGNREFPPSADNQWDFEVDIPNDHLRININLQAGNLEDGLSRAGHVFYDLQALDQTARHEIRKEYSEEPSTSEYFVRYFEEGYSSEEVAEFFGTDDQEEIGVDELLNAIRLETISFNLGSDGDFLVLDYKLHALESDQILVVYFNSEGIFQGLAVESM